MLCGLVSLTLASVTAVSPAAATFPGRNGGVVATMYVDEFGELDPFFPDDSWSLRRVAASGRLDRPFSRRIASWCGAESNAQSLGWDCRDAAYSPSGHRLLAALETETNGEQLVVADADGSNAGLLPVPGVAWEQRDLAWSPHARRVAYVDNRPGRAGESIYTMDLSGRSVRRVTGGSAPDWSRRGLIALIRRGHGIYVVRPTGAGLRRIRRITDSSVMSDGVSWSPNGRELAFCERGRLSVISERGSGLRRLTSACDCWSTPAWSPDGRLIAFIGDLGRRHGLWGIPVRGGTPRRIMSARGLPGYGSENSVAHQGLDWQAQ